MSHARLQSELNSNPAAQESSISIAVQWDENLSRRMDIINRARVRQEQEKLAQLYNGSYSLSTLEDILKKSPNPTEYSQLNADEKSIVEEYKLAIMLAVQTHLKTAQDKQNANSQEEKRQADNDQRAFSLKNILKKIAFVVMFMAGLGLDSMGSFLYGQTLFALIPGLTNPFIFAGAAVLALASAALFYSFEAEMLRNWIGISSLREKNKTLLQLDSEQIDATEKINQLLNTNGFSNSVSLGEYASYIRITKLFNKQISNKDIIINDSDRKKEHTETIPHKLLKWAVTGIGAIMTISGGYFLATSLIAAIAAPLLGTPVGWAIVGGVMVTCLVYFLCMRAQGMRNIMQEKTARFEKVKTQLTDFKGPEKDLSLDNNHTLKKTNLDLVKENLDLVKNNSQSKISSQDGYSGSAGLLFFPKEPPIKNGNKLHAAIQPTVTLRRG